MKTKPSAIKSLLAAALAGDPLPEVWVLPATTATLAGAMPDGAMRPIVLQGFGEGLRQALARRGIGQRQGLADFFRIPGYLGGAGGHIDILLPSIGVKVCGSECYWDCAEVWFWEIR